MIKLFDKHTKCDKCKILIQNKIKLYKGKIYHKYCFNNLFSINKKYGIYKKIDSKNKTLLQST